MVSKCMTQSIGKGSHPLLLHPVIQLVHISLIIGIVDMYKMQENKNQYFYEKSSTPPSISDLYISFEFAFSIHSSQGTN